MTEHFEDLDAAKLDCYVRELEEASAATGFVFVPGVEVHLSGIDTIFFPVRTYDEIKQYESDPERNKDSFCKVLAHPTKYRFDDVIRHLERYELDGIELWNQQADGSNIPPFELLKALETLKDRREYRYFFGCDLHSAELAVRNVLVLDGSVERTSGEISTALKSGEFTSQNLPTGLQFRNPIDCREFDSWVQAVRSRSYFAGKILRSVRRCLRSVYKQLPRGAQRSLNDVKNTVRNKI
ncbi:MAG TPA: hypothetical protein VGI45_29660 [Terracidiphilus sp.]|jgi:hypothetical protein